MTEAGVVAPGGAAADRSPGGPPVVIVRHPRENLSKCSVEPLRHRRDLAFTLRFVDWPCSAAEALGAGDPRAFIRLDPDGPPLTAADAHRGLVLVDATWRLALPMHAAFATVPGRSLGSGWRTAYPRSSKVFDDPDEGLATVEALHAAFVLLGRPGADDLLRDYRWRDAWYRENASKLGSEGSPPR